MQQAELLAAQYDAVVANPPYMGSKYYCPSAEAVRESTFLRRWRRTTSHAAFMIGTSSLASRRNGHDGMITIQSWMFLSSSFEDIAKSRCFKVRQTITSTWFTTADSGLNRDRTLGPAATFVLRKSRSPDLSQRSLHPPVRDTSRVILQPSAEDARARGFTTAKWRFSGCPDRVHFRIPGESGRLLGE